MIGEIPTEPSRLILVVEDTDEAYELFSDGLADAGFRVIGAETGIDAIDMAVKQRPDLILMDLSLPRMGGCEAARLLKQDLRTCHIPIVAITGHEDWAKRATDAGCDAFFHKPCRFDLILLKIEELFSRELKIN